jgi:peroxiredoxin
MSDCLSQREAGSARALILASIFATAAMLMLAATIGRTPAAPQVAFVSLAGERITSAGLRGKVVLVKFWATDCVTCVKEMPDMVRTYNRYRNRGFEFIAVAMRHNPPNYVINYADENRLPFKVALDPMGEIAKAFGNVILTPTTFVIDKRGAIVMKISGEMDVARLNALLEEKLKEQI